MKKEVINDMNMDLGKEKITLIENKNMIKIGFINNSEKIQSYTINTLSLYSMHAYYQYLHPKKGYIGSNPNPN